MKIKNFMQNPVKPKHVDVERKKIIIVKPVEIETEKYTDINILMSSPTEVMPDEKIVKKSM